MTKTTAVSLADNVPIDVDATVPLFAQTWHKTVSAMFETLELIQKHERRPGFVKLCDALEEQGIIKRSVMSMLQRVIASPLLMAPEHRDKLPSSYNTLWTLATYPEDALEARLLNNEVTPALTLEVARQWKSETQTSPKKAVLLFGRLVIKDEEIVKSNAGKIDLYLGKLKELGLDVVVSKPKQQ
jgi:hypothetical protein